MVITSNQEQVKRKILYAEAIYGEEEKQAVLKSMDNKWLASGPLVKQFEESIAKLFGKKYGIAVNSGSSANLLALHCLNLPRDSEVITPACTFSTTVSSIYLNNLVPVFVDSVVGKYTINENLIEAAISPKTKAMLVPQLVGSVCNMKKIRELADKYNLILIDDSCDTIAPHIDDRSAASYSDLTTTSFYGSHIITALGFGGMILTDSEEYRNKLITLRDWGRVGDDKEAFEKRFNFAVDGIPYDSKFIYGELGFNVKMNEAAAAFGLEQLKRLPKFLEIRNTNFQRLTKFFSQYEKWFYIPSTTAETNWLAFPLTVRSNAPFTRYEFLKHMESCGIQTRVLFSGNITRHPLYKKLAFRVSGELKDADEIMAAGLLLGCHQGLKKDDIDYICKSAQDFFKTL